MHPLEEKYRKGIKKLSSSSLTQLSTCTRLTIIQVDDRNKWRNEHCKEKQVINRILNPNEEINLFN